MIPKERRKFPRIATDNLHSTITFIKGSSQTVSQMECRIVNISVAGLQIETKFPIKSEHIHLGVIDLENNPIEIKGRVVYCNKISPKKYHVGISFISSDSEIEQLYGDVFKRHTILSTKA
jgi:PilZ domain